MRRCGGELLVDGRVRVACLDAQTFRPRAAAGAAVARDRELQEIAE